MCGLGAIISASRRKFCEAMRIKTNFKWVIKIVLISIAASMTFTLVSAEVLGNTGYIAAFVILALFIMVGIISDIIAIAVTASVEAPFHSMAAHRERGAREALQLVKNADKVASICNDVIGDVAGIVSGTTAALIATMILYGISTESLPLQLLIPGAVTGLTIGGKAVGKAFAFNNSTAIVLRVGKFIRLFKKRG